jgi:hypothetical protein
VTAAANAVGSVQAGSILPIRYDAADRSYLDIDRQALLHRHARFDEEADQAKTAEAEDRLRRHDN